MESAQYSLKAALTHIWPCSRGANSAAFPGPRLTESNPALWRPWVLSARDVQLETSQRLSGSDGDQSSARSKGAHGFQHPVRLYMPKSKCQEYLQNTGEKVLSSFPVQATIHFYNDDTDTEDEEDEAQFYHNYQNCNDHVNGDTECTVEQETEPMARWKSFQGVDH